MSDPISKLKDRLYDANALGSAIGIFSWDQQTYMPHGGNNARAEHLSLLHKMHHELTTSDEHGRAIEEAEKVAEGDDADLVRVAKRTYEIATKLPTELVSRKTLLAAKGHELWVEARSTNNFALFEPNLKEMFDIAREEAELLGYTDHIYTALLDQYEEGSTHADATAMFNELKGPQTQLVKEIAAQPEVDDSFLYGTFSEADQSKFTHDVVAAIGFDLNRGRQDTAPHPFCTGWSIGDIRLTTRYKSYLMSSVMGSMHEAGHGMYEQGSPMKWDRLPLAGGVSLGIHESQSRFWENVIGRSEGFWSIYLPKLKSAFPQIGDVTLPQFYKALNKVKPTFIRVEADELTYNLHVMTRFELESEILTGALAVRDLPDAWNAKYEEYLGITPPSDSVGCLQDVHWSGGMIGYFPTYSMGNLLSYQFWAALQKDIPDAEEKIGEGKFQEIHGWLLEKIYRKGQSVPPKQLVLQVTGKPISAKDYLAGMNSKYRALYGLEAASV